MHFIADYRLSERNELQKVKISLRITLRRTQRSPQRDSEKDFHENDHELGLERDS